MLLVACVLSMLIYLYSVVSMHCLVNERIGIVLMWNSFMLVSCLSDNPVM